MTTSNLELHGLSTPLEKEILLRAGPFEAVFEPSRAYLREVRIHGTVAVRNVYVHVRAPEWETIVPDVTMLEQRVGSNHFELTWKGIHLQGEVDFEWIGTLVGNPSGIFYKCEGEAKRSFKTNRTSLCVLLPREFQGQVASIDHSDGSKSSAQMPVTVAPQQPLKAMHSVSIGPVKLTFDGAAFDAEDQRNWTDASFKAYPANSRQPTDGLRSGDKVAQSVRIEATGLRLQSMARIKLAHPKKGPWVGARVVNDSDDLSGLPVDFLRVELPNDPTIARHLLDHSMSAGLPVHVVVPKGLPVPTLRDGDVLILEAAEKRPASIPNVWLGAGPFYAFNMGRHEANGFDGVEVNGTPQIHTFDEASILDNSATLSDVVESLAAILEGDVSLNMSMGLNGPDPRLTSLFGAVWILGSYVAASSPNRSYVTLGTTGELRCPQIEALLKELGNLGQHQFLGREIRGLIVSRGIPKVLQIEVVGNMHRVPVRYPFLNRLRRAQTLTINGWVTRHLEPNLELGPYEIVRLESDPPKL